MSITPQWKDELRARVTLSSVIMRTTKLQRAGREWKACCPFHNEKTPSFTVNDEKGFYHCFGCGAHGDVISWMTDQRGLPFMDAVKELAAQAGMEVPRPDPVAAKQAEKRASLVDVTEAAQSWFVEMLDSPDGARAREYLGSRGFSSQIIREFGFGYAPDSKVALKGALANFDEQMLVESGMQISVDGKAPYDRFRDRLMLPIQDQRGRVIAFGGRILESRDGVAKYLNSPDTPLFDKGRTLYNLHRAGPASRQTNRIVVVEGYMDVIALANAGISDAVAPLGTALTENQLTLLWRMVDAPVLCFDGDNAGQRAAMRAVDRALPRLVASKDIGFVYLPDGLDPDDYVRRYGAPALEDLISRRTDLLNFIWQTESSNTAFDTPTEVAFLRQKLIEKAFLIEDQELQKLFRRALLDFYYARIYPQRDRNQRSSKHGLIDAQNLSLLRHFVENGSRYHLARAVFSALARHTVLIPRFFEKVAQYVPQDDDVKYVVNVFLDVLESQIDGVGSPDQALSEIASWSCPLRFPFLKNDAEADFVAPFIEEALTILVDIPVVERKLRQVSAQFGDEDSELVQLEQTELRNTLTGLRERLGKAASMQFA